MARLSLDMILNMKDSASKTLDKFNSKLDKTKQKLKETARLSSRSTSGQSGGSGGGGGGGLTGAGVLGAGALGAGAITKGAGTVSAAITRMYTNIEEAASALTTLSTSFAIVNEKVSRGIPLNKAYADSAEEIEEAYDLAADSVDTANREINENTVATTKNTKANKKSISSWKKWGSVVAIAGAIVGAALKQIFDIGRRYEKLRATLSAVIPKQDSVGEAFSFIQKMASQLPTTVEQTTTAFIRMQSLGIVPTEKRMISFGNTAAAMGKDILQFVEAVADASVGEFERLKEFGIKAKSQGEDVSFTFQGTTTTVKKSAKEITDYLQSIGDVQFAGAAAKQMDTLDGKLSNLSDTFSNVADTIYTAGLDNTFKGIVDWLVKVVNWTGKAYFAISGFVVSSLGLINKMTVHIKAAARAIEAIGEGNLTGILKAMASRDRELAAIDQIVTSMKADYDAMFNNSNAAEVYADKLQKRADAANAAAKAEQNLITVTGGYQTQSLNEFMKELNISYWDNEAQTKNITEAHKILERQLKNGAISAEEYGFKIKQLSEMSGEAADTITEFWQEAARNMQDAMGNTFFDWMQGKTSDMVGDFKRMIDRMVAELIASNLLKFMVGNFTDGGKVGGVLGDIFRADGGPVSAGKPYIVGERGPELHIPKTNGTIISNSDIQGMGGSNVTINLNAIDTQSGIGFLEGYKREIAEMVTGTNNTYNLSRGF